MNNAARLTSVELEQHDVSDHIRSALSCRVTLCQRKAASEVFVCETAQRFIRTITLAGLRAVSRLLLSCVCVCVCRRPQARFPSTRYTTIISDPKIGATSALTALHKRIEFSFCRFNVSHWWSASDLCEAIAAMMSTNPRGSMGQSDHHIFTISLIEFTVCVCLCSELST